MFKNKIPQSLRTTILQHNCMSQSRTVYSNYVQKNCLHDKGQLNLFVRLIYFIPIAIVYLINYQQNL